MPEVPPDFTKVSDQLFRLTIDRASDLEQLVQLARVISPTLHDHGLCKTAEQLDQLILKLDATAQRMDDIIRSHASEMIRAARAMFTSDPDPQHAAIFRRRNPYPGADS